MGSSSPALTQRRPRRARRLETNDERFPFSLLFAFFSPGTAPVDEKVFYQITPRQATVVWYENQKGYICVIHPN